MDPFQNRHRFLFLILTYFEKSNIFNQLLMGFEGAALQQSKFIDCEQNFIKILHSVNLNMHVFVWVFNEH